MEPCPERVIDVSGAAARVFVPGAAPLSEPLVLAAVAVDLPGRAAGDMIPCKELIAAARERGGVGEGEMLVVRTGGAGLDYCCARWLVSEGVAAVGTDGAEIGDERTREALLEGGIVVVEGIAGMEGRERFAAVICGR